MAGLVPAIHVFAAAQGREDVDARDKRGHDGGESDPIRTRLALVYYVVTDDAYAAITREKQIKAGSRGKKIDLINGMNPEWRDLYEDL